jgi:hypothetical protein
MAAPTVVPQLMREEGAANVCSADRQGEKQIRPDQIGQGAGTQNSPAWLVRPSQTKHIGDDAAELVAVEHDIGHRPMRTLQRRG